MDPRKLFADERSAFFCVYCGGTPSTADHVPSRVLLDEPYPNNLPVVPACEACNNGFSIDEPYLACLVTCALTGSVDPQSVHRRKVKRILEARPALASEIAACRHEDEHGNVLWAADVVRVKNVILKLARGHAAYEYSEPHLEIPAHVSFVPLGMLSANQLRFFEEVPTDNLWPEVGSQAFQRTVNHWGNAAPNGWQVVQPDCYRYLVYQSGSTIVRFVLSEYLACEVKW